MQMDTQLQIRRRLDTTGAYCKVRQDWIQQEHTAKCDRTGYNRNILQSETGLDTTGTYCKVRQDWIQQEHTAKCDRTGYNRNILQSATGLDTTGTYCKSSYFSELLSVGITDL